MVLILRVLWSCHSLKVPNGHVLKILCLMKKFIKEIRRLSARNTIDVIGVYNRNNQTSVLINISLNSSMPFMC